MVSAVALVGFGAAWILSTSAAPARPARDAPAAVSDAVFRPTLDGRLECVAPNVEHRTCKAMAIYRRRADGSIELAATSLANATPMILMKSVGTVTFTRDGMCASGVRQAFEKAEFTIDGVPASASQTARFRSRVVHFGREATNGLVCDHYVATGDNLMDLPTLDGKPVPEAVQRVLFVSPAEGYSVSP